MFSPESPKLLPAFYCQSPYYVRLRREFWHHLSANQISGFILELMLEGGGVAVQGGCFEAELSYALGIPTG
jgi:hypothetical protein